MEHGYIEEENNPCSRIIPTKTIYRLTEEQERADDRIVIPPEQLIALNAQFRKDYEKQPGYMPVYALELAALTGMRAGEIVALKWDDIHGRYIEVRRRESVDKITGEIQIKPIPFDVTEDSKKYDVLDQVNQFMLNPWGSPGRSR